MMWCIYTFSFESYLSPPLDAFVHDETKLQMFSDISNAILAVLVEQKASQSNSQLAYSYTSSGHLNTAHTT